MASHKLTFVSEWFMPYTGATKVAIKQLALHPNENVTEIRIA